MKSWLLVALIVGLSTFAYGVHRMTIVGINYESLMFQILGGVILLLLTIEPKQ